MANYIEDSYIRVDEIQSQYQPEEEYSFESILKSNELQSLVFVEASYVYDTLCNIESDINIIINLIKQCDTREALIELRALKEKIY